MGPASESAAALVNLDAGLKTIDFIRNDDSGSETSRKTAGKAYSA
jgi:hypothetical protein